MQPARRPQLASIYSAAGHGISSGQGKRMKPLFWIGLVVLVLGVASLFVAIPNRERHGVSVGGAEVGVEVKQSRKVAPIVSAVLIVGGVGLMLAGRGRAA